MEEVVQNRWLVVDVELERGKEKGSMMRRRKGSV